MRLWRVSNHADLSGLGGTLVSGRWPGAGRPILYTAEHPAAAILEMLAHMDRADIPSTYQMLEIEVGDGATFAQDAALENMPTNWRSQPDLTRAIGDAWLARGETLLLRVPSVLAPRTTNVLINPRHAEMAKVRVLSAERLDLDRRLG